MKTKLKKTTGFTLIELLLYVGIMGVIIFSFAGFLSLLMQSRIKNQVVSEVEQQGIQVMQMITQIGRNAGNINYPAPGQITDSLSFDSTVFDRLNNAVRITEGTDSPTSLTNSHLIASNLTFQNLSRVGTPGTVRIQLTLTYANPSGRNEYNYSKTFYGTASLR